MAAATEKRRRRLRDAALIEVACFIPRQQVNQAVEDEIGDLLFAVVNLARKCKLDAESTLQTATDKFVARFNRLEDELQGRLCLVRAGAVALDGSHDWHSRVHGTGTIK